MVYEAYIVFQVGRAALEHDTDLFISLNKKYKVNCTVLERSK